MTADSIYNAAPNDTRYHNCLPALIDGKIFPWGVASLKCCATNSGTSASGYFNIHLGTNKTVVETLLFINREDT